MSSKKLTEREELLVELVHLLAFGQIILDDRNQKWHDSGLTLKQTKWFLQKPMKSGSQSALERLDLEGRGFLNELITYINQRS